MFGMRVIGLAGWSGAGKTTLLVRVIPVLVGRGLKVATLKNAHHDFDTDRPGKDSREHRRAEASEVLVSSGRRWALFHELGDEPKATLAELLQLLSPCDLVVIEGFKRGAIPKIEVFRNANGRPALYPGDPLIVGAAGDVPFERAGVPVVDLDDAEAVAGLMRDLDEPIDFVFHDLARAHD
ncbi:molybdopterin-guanine dinucleotide biosynthesis protein MobB [Methylobacterium sp. Leaf113]|uniref:molybdopterin-guanine dinucleotide biosynthesis protein B n=1 Tax=unclassified Methylobacterium TaxID=2615210 RepID=UPI0006FCA70D|nr:MULTISPECIES: molybdopterin-guanine dinucleotide biosynthesis protein B [unclassified Methylobacterium]KQP77470.1 molybdopterin-guanine dinucleotide biosynthesis protein MobB [Methylobacterium sp. Leaf117]KQP80365.1 molybdopterin-guanine dinucleotide biosynthesis protein MobB [Methylobacterium sp. Leaf113]